MTRPFPTTRTPALRWLLSMLFVGMLVLGFSLAAHAQTTPPAAPVDVDTQLNDVRKQLDGIQKALKADEADADLVQLRDTALQARSTADQIATAIQPQLESVQARLTELGTPAKDAKEDPDVARQRAQLDKTRGSLDAQVKLARLLTVEADQAADQIRGTRRSLFQAQLGARTASILAKPFWSDLRDDMPRDLVRLQLLGSELGSDMRLTPPLVWVVAIAAVLAIVAARIAASRLLMRLTSTKVPPGRLRRSLHALTIVVLDTITPGLISLALLLAMTWNDSLSETATGILATTAGSIWFGGYVAGLGSALFSPNRPSWRLPTIPDPIAYQLRWFPMQLAVMAVIAWVTERIGALVNASLSTTVAANCIVALALASVMGIASMRVEHLRRRALREADQPIPPRPLWLALLSAASSIVLFGSLVCLLVGYVAFGSFAVKQVVWVVIVLGSGYLLSVLVDDLCMGLIATPRPKDAKDAGDAKAPKDAADKDAAPAASTPRGRDQLAVLLSGVVRVCILLLGVTLVLAPFGDGPSDLFRRANQIQGGLSIGEVIIKPGTVIQALIVLALSWLCVTWAKRWLQDRYLPTTSMDPGMQVSAATLFGYAGYVLSIALAMSAVGIGLERVAWVASALSVGIGFGLQAVVQNFVSGLILLAERPVKVGDWVSLTGVEGDIRRINVRATEIQMGDRSTVIVPNSEFITKTVRNVTHASPLGLVQMRLPMPLDTDVRKVRDLILAAFDEHPDIIKTAPVKVQLDAVETDRLIFNSTGSVASPRLAYGVRSDILFDVLVRLAEARQAAASTADTAAAATAAIAALTPIAAVAAGAAADANPDEPGAGTASPAPPSVPGSPAPSPQEQARKEAAQPPIAGAGGLPISS